MLTMNDFVDLRMQQQIAHEIYRQQIMQRIPDPFPSMLGLPLPHAVIMPPRPTLTGVEAKLENNDLWRQFHSIGTEMIITKSGRRMFPSMRVSFSGLEDESNYCVLLEMVPIGDCRYKFSGSQWVPAGGAEPQSPQRMFLHPDSPATGAHWQSQAILFNKVKLTNNTLDSNGHIVLASMHKYQPRLHIIRTSELAQLPWAPQQAFVFPETEFVAVTAYQNDRITKLKIDNNPFAKGFRETGQSRCKRKLSALNDDLSATEQSNDSVNLIASGKSLNNITSNNNNNNNNKSNSSSSSGSSTGASNIEDDRSSVGSFDLSHHKRLRSSNSFDDDICYSSNSSNGTISPRFDESMPHYHPYAHPHPHSHPHAHHHHHQSMHQQQLLASTLYHHQHPSSALLRGASLDLAAAAYFAPPSTVHSLHNGNLLQTMPSMAHAAAPHHPHHHHNHHFGHHHSIAPFYGIAAISPNNISPEASPSPAPASPKPVPAAAAEATTQSQDNAQDASPPPADAAPNPPTQTKRNSFSISSILAY